jgi:3-methyladenine DNA glycosylase Mpg
VVSPWAFALIEATHKVPIKKKDKKSARVQPENRAARGRGRLAATLGVPRRYIEVSLFKNNGRY